MNIYIAMIMQIWCIDESNSEWFLEIWKLVSLVLYYLGENILGFKIECILDLKRTLSIQTACHILFYFIMTIFY